MSTEEKRPVGVAILSWVHIVAGASAATTGLIAIALSVVLVRIQAGIPIEWMIGLAVPSLLGVWLGVGMQRAREWAWHTGSLFYLLWWVSGLLHYVFVLGRGTTPPAPPIVLLREVVAGWVTYGMGAVGIFVGLPIYIYFFKSSVREHFGLGKKKRWKPVTAQLALGVVIALGVAYVERQAGADRNISRLRRIGYGGESGEDGFRFMLRRLERGTADERIFAAWALRKSGKSDAVPALLRAAREDSNANVRINAITALAELGGEDMESAFLVFLEDFSGGQG